MLDDHSVEDAQRLVDGFAELASIHGLANAQYVTAAAARTAARELQQASIWRTAAGLLQQLPHWFAAQGAMVGERIPQLLEGTDGGAG